MSEEHGGSDDVEAVLRLVTMLARRLALEDFESVQDLLDRTAVKFGLRAGAVMGREHDILLNAIKRVQQLHQDIARLRREKTSRQDAIAMEEAM